GGCRRAAGAARGDPRAPGRTPARARSRRAARRRAPLELAGRGRTAARVSSDEAPPREREIFGIDRRKALLTGAGALVLAVAAVVGIGQVTSFQHVVDALRRADPAWFPVCLGGELAAYAGY